jgi:hypothetical protein
MPDQDALVEQIELCWDLEALERLGVDTGALARAVLPVVEGHAKAERKAGAVDALREVDGMPKADWSSAWAELYGYAIEARDDRAEFQAHEVATYMIELKNRYVTGPGREWLRRAGKQ